MKRWDCEISTRGEIPAESEINLPGEFDLWNCILFRLLEKRHLCYVFGRYGRTWFTGDKHSLREMLCLCSKTRLSYLQRLIFHLCRASIILTSLTYLHRFQVVLLVYYFHIVIWTWKWNLNLEHSLHNWYLLRVYWTLPQLNQSDRLPRS